MTPLSPQKTPPVQGARDFLRDALHLARANVRTLLLLATALIFVLLLEEVAEGEIMQLDVYAYRFFVQTLRSEGVTPIMEGFTSLAALPVVIVTTCVIAALAPGKAPGWCVCANLVGAVALNQVLKYLIQRPRPDGFRLATEVGYSFPSGHSMVSMAFYGLIIWMIWRYHKRDIMRLVWCAVFGLIIVMVGISRIYLGVHYASDVIAGFCVSTVWLVFYTKIVAPAFMSRFADEASEQSPLTPGDPASL